MYKKIKMKKEIIEMLKTVKAALNHVNLKSETILVDDIIEAVEESMGILNTETINKIINGNTGVINNASGNSVINSTHNVCSSKYNIKSNFIESIGDVKNNKF